MGGLPFTQTLRLRVPGVALNQDPKTQTQALHIAGGPTARQAFENAVSSNGAALVVIEVLIPNRRQASTELMESSTVGLIMVSNHSLSEYFIKIVLIYSYKILLYS